MNLEPINQTKLYGLDKHITELMKERTLRGDMWQERLDACKTIKTKLK